MKDKKRFGQTLSTLAATFRQEIPAETFKAYWWALENELTDEEFEAAARVAVKGTRFPTAADLLASKPGAVDIESQSREAMALLQQKMRNPGAYGSVDFEDQAINAAVRDWGGWTKLCRLDIDEWRKYEREKLRTLYLHYRRHGAPEPLSWYLQGEIELTNLNNGYRAKKPEYVPCCYLPAGAVVIREERDEKATSRVGADKLIADVGKSLMLENKGKQQKKPQF